MAARKGVRSGHLADCVLPPSSRRATKRRRRMRSQDHGVRKRRWPSRWSRRRRRARRARPAPAAWTAERSRRAASPAPRAPTGQRIDQFGQFRADRRQLEMAIGGIGIARPARGGVMGLGAPGLEARRRGPVDEKRLAKAVLDRGLHLRTQAVDDLAQRHDAGGTALDPFQIVADGPAARQIRKRGENGGEEAEQGGRIAGAKPEGSVSPVSDRYRRCGGPPRAAPALSLSARWPAGMARW